MQQVSGQGQQRSWQAQTGARTGAVIPATIDGLWVLLVTNEGELPESDADGRAPMMARAGDDQPYLLAFRNVAKARLFLNACETAAEARMVVKANKPDLLRICASAKCAGVLLDYDLGTQEYAAAIALA